jgi:membrane protein CcdC involved in cytochrome C biogenesis
VEKNIDAFDITPLFFLELYTTVIPWKAEKYLKISN